jgi:hypothetical protein
MKIMYGFYIIVVFEVFYNVSIGHRIDSLDKMAVERYSLRGVSAHSKPSLIVNPPSTIKFTPFTKLIRGVLNITTASPISAGSARRPCRASNLSHNPSVLFSSDEPSRVSILAVVIAVSRKPGESAFTRMQWARASSAACLAKVSQEEVEENECGPSS